MSSASDSTVTVALRIVLSSLRSFSQPFSRRNSALLPLGTSIFDLAYLGSLANLSFRNETSAMSMCWQPAGSCRAAVTTAARPSSLAYCLKTTALVDVLPMSRARTTLKGFPSPPWKGCFFSRHATRQSAASGNRRTGRPAMRMASRRLANCDAEYAFGTATAYSRCSSPSIWPTSFLTKLERTRASGRLFRPSAAAGTTWSGSRSASFPSTSASPSAAAQLSKSGSPLTSAYVLPTRYGRFSTAEPRLEDSWFTAGSPRKRCSEPYVARVRVECPPSSFRRISPSPRTMSDVSPPRSRPMTDFSIPQALHASLPRCADGSPRRASVLDRERENAVWFSWKGVPAGDGRRGEAEEAGEAGPSIGSC